MNIYRFKDFLTLAPETADPLLKQALSCSYGPWTFPPMIEQREQDMLSAYSRTDKVYIKIWYRPMDLKDLLFMKGKISFLIQKSEKFCLYLLAPSFQIIRDEISSWMGGIEGGSVFLKLTCLEYILLERGSSGVTEDVGFKECFSSAPIHDQANHKAIEKVYPRYGSQQIASPGYDFFKESRLTRAELLALMNLNAKLNSIQMKSVREVCHRI